MSTRPRFAVAALLAAAIALAAIGVDGRAAPTGGRLSIVVADATNVVPGARIRLGGTPVGEVASITAVERGRAARLVLRLDGAAWPVRRGTRLLLRWGGTANYGDRYLRLVPGPAGGPAYRDGDELPRAALATPVEFDQLLGTFDPALRRDLRRAIDHAGPALRRARRPLAGSLRRAPEALDAATGVLGDLAADQRALDLLLRTGARTLAAVDRARPGVREVLGGLGTTLSATGSRSRELERTIERLPATLGGLRRTLATADPTLTEAGTLARRLRPGVAELRRIATPLNRVLATVVDVAPDLQETLATAGDATKDLDPLLERVRTVAPQLTSIGRQATTELTCLRPYTPDVVAFFSNWGDFLSNDDGRDAFVRADVQLLLPAPTNLQSNTSGEAAKLFPGLRYAFPQPPGYNAGQPWFQPACGVGPDSVDPSKDREARR